jgi:hypothetical protein
MAGLNDLITDTKTEATTLPNWYSKAQEGVVAKALTAESPAVGDTAAKYAIDSFGPEGAFASGKGILESIGSGAANPWLVTTDATGAETINPNTGTALGGLFKAQQDYLNQILPDIDADTSAGAIAGGGFGSRMNLSGLSNARSKAASDLFQKQMQSALQAQQTGVSAGAALGNIGNQEVQSALNTGTYQQNAPYATPMNLANIISKLNVPTTKTSSSELGGLNQVLGLLSLTGGGLNSLLGGTKSVGGKEIRIPGLIDQIKGLYGGVKDFFTPELDPADLLTNPALPGQEGYGWKYYSDGTVIDPSGQYYQDGELVWSPFWGDDYQQDYDSDSNTGDSSWMDDFDWDAWLGTSDSGSGSGGFQDSDNWDLF